MNEIQLKRWKKITLGLAKKAHPAMSSCRKHLMEEEAASFIEYIEAHYQLHDIIDWDGDRGECYVGDELNAYLWRQGWKFEREVEAHIEVFQCTFGNDLIRCIRAGFDVAVKPSGCAFGFTVEDLQRLFAGKAPLWAKERFNELNTAVATTGDAI